MEDMATELLRRIGTNVRARRLAAGMTLKAASEKSELHWRHWQKIEAGEVHMSVPTLARVAVALAVAPPVLFAT